MPPSDIARAGAKINTLSMLLDIPPGAALGLLSMQALAQADLTMLQFWKAVADYLRPNLAT